MSIKEAILLGETLAELKPKLAKQEMEDWVRPKGLITLGSVRDHQQYAAVKGSFFDTWGKAMWIKYENFVRQQEQNYRIIVGKLFMKEARHF